MRKDADDASAAQISRFNLQWIGRADAYPVRPRVMQIAEDTSKSASKISMALAKRGWKLQTRSAALALALLSSRCTNTAFKWPRSPLPGCVWARAPRRCGKSALCNAALGLEHLADCHRESFMRIGNHQPHATATASLSS